MWFSLFSNLSSTNRKCFFACLTWLLLDLKHWYCYCFILSCDFVCGLAESKSTNDTSRGQPVVPIGSSSTTSNAESTTPSTPKIGEELKISPQLRKFSFNELKSATKSFRPECLLGEGGFGCVYKGWINMNGTATVKPGTGLPVAVKTLNHDGLQGHKEWLVREHYHLI